MFRITTAATALFLLCAGAEAAGYYGALAYSPETGAYGRSTNRQTRANAQSWAMYYCNQYANDCRIAINFVNACGAVARGRNGGWGADWGYNRSQAQNDAVAACSYHDSGCRIIQSGCSQ